MFSSPKVGLLLVLGVIYLGIVREAINPWVFLNHHAMILVIGGTIAVTVLTYPLKKLVDVYNFVIYGFYLKKRVSEKAIIEDMLLTIHAFYKAKRKRTPLNLNWDPAYPFLRDGINLLAAHELSVTQIETILRSRKEAMKRKYSEDAKILNSIAKYPPHLGLLGASSGMIEMMSGLGKSGISTIGAAMATALTATLWGIGLNNFVFLPLADNAQKAVDDDMYLRDIVIEIVVGLKQNQDEKVVLEKCVSKLSVNHRVELKNYFKLNPHIQQPEDQSRAS